MGYVTHWWGDKGAHRFPKFESEREGATGVKIHCGVTVQRVALLCGDSQTIVCNYLY